MPHPDTGELVLVTREEIMEHAEAAHRVLETAQRYDEKQARWHGRLIGRCDRTSVGDTLRRTAADLGIDPAGRSFEALAELVAAAAEARARARSG